MPQPEPVRSGPDSVASDPSAERVELDRILRSPLFVRSPTLSRLLAHVCERSLAGLDAELKESTIAVELFRRPADFDPRHDPIVRVTANRLRLALSRFYRKHGCPLGIEIALPVGQYVPIFQRQAPQAATGVEGSEGARAAEPGVTSPGPKPPLSSPVRAGATGPRTRGLLTVAALATLAGLATGLLLAPRIGRAPTRSAVAAAPSTAATSRTAVVLADSGVRLLAGGREAAIDRLGRRWSADAFYEGGSAVSLPAVEAGAEHPAYRSARKGRFAYDIPLPPGTYELRLHFIETEFGDARSGAETSRFFDVFVNGRRVIRDLDVAADAGGSRTPDVRVLTDVEPAADGLLHLRFSHPLFEAMLSGIEILPGERGRMRPLRMTAQSTPFVGASGLLWEPDHFVRGGRTVPRERPVAGTSEPGLFRAERFGNFRYTIPAAPGRYRLTLTFAETFFGASNGVPVGAGARVFDVFCNGEALLRNLDVFHEAGGENRALVRSFEHLTPNAQQKLILDFVPVRNLATLTALELVAE